MPSNFFCESCKLAPVEWLAVYSQGGELTVHWLCSPCAVLTLAENDALISLCSAKVRRPEQ